MKQLTQRQEEYLLLFADRDGKCKGISEAAELFQVSKPTAFNMSEALEERGLIVKSSFGEIRLTESGWAYISSRLEYLYTLIEWLESDLGLPPLLAEQEARRMVVVLAPETVAAVAQRWKKSEQRYSRVRLTICCRSLRRADMSCRFRSAVRAAESFPWGIWDFSSRPV